MSKKLRIFSALSLSVLASTFLSAGLASAAITVTVAKISAGKLMVTGSSPSGTSVKLDGTYSAALNVSHNFSFNLTYLPTDCIVDLALVGASAPVVHAVIADCGPKGVTPRGGWSNAITYIENDLASLQGSTWRARKNALANLNKNPVVNPLFWEKFVAKGDTGAAGVAGPPGPSGQTMFKRAVFNETVAPTGVNQIKSLTFTSPVTGKALVRAQGHCRVELTSSLMSLEFTVDTSLSHAFTDGDKENWAIVIDETSATAGAVLDWSLAKDMSVSAGVANTLLLAGNNISGVATTCSGSMDVEVFTGTLP